jgi:hypothetical protein
MIPAGKDQREAVTKVIQLPIFFPYTRPFFLRTATQRSRIVFVSIFRAPSSAFRI